MITCFLLSRLSVVLYARGHDALIAVPQHLLLDLRRGTICQCYEPICVEDVSIKYDGMINAPALKVEEQRVVWVAERIAESELNAEEEARRRMQ